MKGTFTWSGVFALALTVATPLSSAFAQGTAFTYQGRLSSGSSPANGLYDFRFKLAEDPLGNNFAGNNFLTNAIVVTNGLFTTTINFGPGLFAGSNYWLEVDVRTNDPLNTSTYTGLTPLQPVTPTPYAIMANSASNLLGTLPAGQLTGTVPAANFSGTYGNAVTLDNANNNFTGSYAGNGVNVSNVNALALNGLNATNFWQLGGNNVAPGQFLGSTNNQPVELWVNGGRALRLEPNTNNSPNLVGGSSLNFVNSSVVGAAILGGGGYDHTFGNLTNQVAGNSSTIAGGGGNVILGSYGFSSIGGGVQNNLAGDFSSIGGGQYNNVFGGYATTIGGGSGNNNTGNYSTIAGGFDNVITNASFGGATISGGDNNTNNAEYSTIAGGFGNWVQHSSYVATISGGLYNQTTNAYATVPGGDLNLAGGKYSFAAGQQAQAVHQGAFVWADSQNAPFASTNNDSFNVRAQGGVRLVTKGAGLTVDGYPVIASGSGGGLTVQQNANGAPNVIGGSQINYVGSGFQGATIGGGGATNFVGTGVPISNSVTAYFGTIGGGAGNTISGNFATIAGGNYNLASGQYSTVGGGIQNTAGGGVNGYSTVSGGANNIANATYAAVGGGENNTNTALGGAIGAGVGNSVSGSYATIPGGYRNVAGGQYSLAAGQQAQATNNGAFVWADSQNTPFGSAANDSFNIRAQGGVFLDQTTPAINFGGQTRQMLNLYQTAYGVGVQSFTEYFRSGGGYAWYEGGSHNDGQTNNGGGTTLMTLGGNGNLVTRGTVTASGVLLTSDRNAKESFTPVSSLTVLAKVSAMPITEWQYKADTDDIKHLGPMAQDFHTAFGLDGSDDKHISVVDEGGVALAAIQGLNQKLEAKSQELETANAELKQQNDSLEKRLDRLEQIINAMGRGAN